MLEWIKIENFRCLKHVEVPLRPLTVLIGPNDSGKTAFLAALHILSGGRSLERTDWWRGDRSQDVEITGVGSGFSIHFKNKGGVTGDPGGDHTLRPSAYYALPASGVSMQSQGYVDTGEPPDIGRDGDQVAGLLDHLLRSDRDRFLAFEQRMRDLVPGFEGITIGTPNPEQRRIEFVIEGGFRLSADKTSSGVRLLVFFVALAYHPTPPRLILIEEPENGIHPKRLEKVLILLREVCRGEHGGKPAQIVLTTHSPHLLDHIDPSEDQVLVFQRNDDGSRTAKPADTDRLKNFLDEFMLGEVWYNEGEEGLVAKKPGQPS